ncbi:MAG: type I-E CRISPR-associated endonuclease Cas1 [Bacteroidetes bacterium]|jgi:CRISPR-associated protein Cas1|nr:type I-E CRISPR-associated endonuclease Cas1 [Bacteroidota bacterium]
MVFKGRLGLETARVPHADRHGLMWLARGRLAVEDGNLVFTTAGTDTLEAGAYDIPFQQVSNILLGPGGVVSHDALRLLARHQTGLLAIGSKGVRLYAVSMPFGPDRSTRARQHARLWSDEAARVDVARQMYAMRLGEPLPSYERDLDSLRGIEGARMKRVYRNLSQQYGVTWHGRRYDRSDPESDDAINKAINHAATASYAAARIAVAVTGAIPQLGFIHESSGHAFALDIADLFRSSVTLPIAFRATKRHERRPGSDIESVTRKLAGRTFQKEKVIPQMIDRIKEVLDVDDDRRDA